MKQLYSVLILWLMFIPSIHAETATQDAEEQYTLGMMYRTGERVDEDILLGAEWFRKAAEQGHTNAQYMLGTVYDQIYDATYKDIAIKWLRMAAEKGHIQAQYQLEKTISEQEVTVDMVDILNNYVEDSEGSLSDLITGTK